MKLVIDIPEHAFEECKNIQLSEEIEGVIFHILTCIKNGTPLPSGHNRLIDQGHVMNLLNEAQV